MNIDLYDLKTIIMEMSELGAANYAKRIAPEKDLILQRQAYLRFGEAKIKFFVRMRLINWQRCGPSIRSQKLCSLSEILSVLAAKRHHRPPNWPYAYW